MNPLDRLQELLGERGVKYKHRKFSDLITIEYVRWKGVGGLEFSAICSQSDPEKLYVNDVIISPEDVVRVTLGEADTCVMHKDYTAFLEGANTYVTAWYCDRCLGTTYHDAEFRPYYCATCGRKVKWSV